MGLSRTVSEIDGNFSRTSQNFPTPLIFCAPAEKVPLELGIGAGGQKTRMMWLPGRQRSLTISLAVWIECTNVTGDRRTDHTWPQQRPRLRIASRGKKGLNWLNRHRKICYCSMTDRWTDTYVKRWDMIRQVRVENSSWKQRHTKAYFLDGAFLVYFQWGNSATTLYAQKLLLAIIISSCITLSLFHSRLKTRLFQSFPP